MTSDPHASYVWGFIDHTMGSYSEKQYRKVEQIFKATLSSDCSLEFDYMKLELLVMANQPCRREYVPVPCTHRPSNQPSYALMKSFESESLYSKVG